MDSMNEPGTGENEVVDEPIELGIEILETLKATSAENSSGNQKRKDLEYGLLSPVIAPVTKLGKDISDAFLPKIEPVPWNHFFFLSICVAIP